MRFKLVILSILSMALMFAVHPVQLNASVNIGKPAPNFSLPDVNGKIHMLETYKGQYVVLEWYNKDCPFVRKYYNSGKMQALQKQYTAKDVVWLTITSSAQGKQGHVTAAQGINLIRNEKSSTTAYLLDEYSNVGRMYGAKTTPHMFVINPKGEVVYKGAIDDIPSANPADIKKSKNYVQLSLDAAMAGKPVSTPSSKPYGCSVKY